MRYMTIFLLGLFLSGCATTVPKESLKSIFVEVKKRNHDKAIRMFAHNSENKFAVYKSNHSGLRGSTVRRMISTGSSFLKSCDQIINGLKKLNDQAIDNEDQLESVKKSLASLNRDFDVKCGFAEDDWRTELLVSTKTYSSVDILAEKQDFLLSYKDLNRSLNEKMDKYVADQQTKSEQEKAEEERYKNSPEFYNKKLCEFTELVQVAEGVIAEENEAGSYSGFVDKRKLHRAGKMKQQYLKLINIHKKKYQDKFGKKWSKKACKS